jgi:alkylhydroperoxidase family enzyme
MIKWFTRRWINKFERTWNYDASYLHELLDIDPRALMAFGKASTAIGAYRKDVPPAVYSAAGIVAVMAEDCGPCTQIVIDMAERAGVAPDILRAVVTRDMPALPFEVALAVRFTEATLRHAPEADDLREEVVRRFGKRGLVSLAFAMIAARFYPTLKYAMGHGRACTRLTIGGEAQPVLRALTQAA